MKNIVLLLAFSLVFLYYPTLHDRFSPKRLSLSREKYRAISIFLGEMATSGFCILQPA
jgi:hypothetical protein